jgi:PleD family two-component response regulator
MYTGYDNYDLLFDETASAFHLVYRCPVIFHPAGAALIDGGDMSMTNVLVVDDDIAICRIVHRMLSEEHYNVQTSQSVADALGTIEAEPFNVYVLRTINDAFSPSNVACTRVNPLRSGVHLVL